VAAAKSEARTEAAAVTEQIVICSPELARGSLSHHVATHARRPVLIVPPPAAGA
jgi:hypothetical protein